MLAVFCRPTNGPPIAGLGLALQTPERGWGREKEGREGKELNVNEGIKGVEDIFQLRWSRTGSERKPKLRKPYVLETYNPWK